MSTLQLWTRRDPFADFDALVRQTFAPVATRPTRTITTRTATRPSTGFTPAAEITRDGDDAVVRLELPGVDVDKDVTVEVDRGRLVVRGERRDERETTDRADTGLREVRYGSFRRSFGLPAHVTADDVVATYDAGVLSVRVRGASAGSQPTRVTVTAGPASAPKQVDDAPAEQSGQPGQPVA